MMRRSAIALAFAVAASLASAQAPTPKPTPKKLSLTDKDLKAVQKEPKSDRAAAAPKAADPDAMAWLNANRLANSSATEILDEAKKRNVTLDQIVGWIKRLRLDALEAMSKLESQYKKLKTQTEEQHGKESAEAKALKASYEEKRAKLKLGIQMADDAIKQFSPLAASAAAPAAPGEDPMAIFELGRLSAMQADQITEEFARRNLTTAQILEGMRRVRAQAADQLAASERAYKKHMPEMEKAYGAGSREVRQYADAYSVSTSKLQKLIADADALLARNGAAEPPAKQAAPAAAP